MITRNFDNGHKLAMINMMKKGVSVSIPNLTFKTMTGNVAAPRTTYITDGAYAGWLVGKEEAIGFITTLGGTMKSSALERSTTSNVDWNPIGLGTSADKYTDGGVYIAIGSDSTEPTYDDYTISGIYKESTNYTLSLYKVKKEIFEDKVIMTFTLSGIAITELNINEVGLFTHEIFKSPTYASMLIARDVLPETLVVAPEQGFTVYIKVEVPYGVGNYNLGESALNNLKNLFIFYTISGGGTRYGFGSSESSSNTGYYKTISFLPMTYYNGTQYTKYDMLNSYNVSSKTRNPTPNINSKWQDITATSAGDILYIGSGTTPTTPDMYWLEAPYVQGTDFKYIKSTYDFTYDETGYSVTYHQTIEALKDLSISEVGLGACISMDSYRRFLLTREVLSEPREVIAGDMAIINHTINYRF